MARRKPPDSGPGAAVAANGLSEDDHPPPPAYTVGPIQTAKAEGVAVAVWGKVIAVNGEEVTVYSVTVDCCYQLDGQWRSGHNFKGSQIYALIYSLQKASDWILAQRNPANAPF